MIASAFDTLGWALAFALCVPGLRAKPVRAAGVLIGAVLLLNVPVAGTSLIAALRGLFAGLSVTSVLVLSALLIARVGPAVVFRAGERAVIAGLAALCGLLFYPAVLGLTPVDPYFWGYGGAGLALLAGCVAATCWLLGLRVLALALALALFTWRVQGLASPNLWDYLIDPLFSVGALLSLPVMLICSAKRARRSPAATRSALKSSPLR